MQAALHDVVVDQPKRANGKRPFSAWQPIVGIQVPVDEAVPYESALDSLDGRSHPRVRWAITLSIGRRKTDASSAVDPYDCTNAPTRGVETVAQQTLENRVPLALP
jgi:hypothetical protein